MNDQITRITDPADSDPILQIYQQDAAFAIQMYLDSLAWGDQRGARNWKQEIERCQEYARRRRLELEVEREVTEP